MTPLSDKALDRLQRAPVTPDPARYTLHEALGAGGMGTVYRATDELLEREVALKVAHERTGPGAGLLVEQLRREARILARLEHPGIVPVHDAGVLADGRVFYVMKLVRGRTLDQMTLDHAQALAHIERAAEAVAFAHERGVVHHDIKPENVMVGDFGEVMVMDWGVASLLGASEPGSVRGTPGFMPPEGSLDPRADVFALGILLQRIVPGHHPKRLAAVVRRCIATVPTDRYDDAGQVLAELQRLRAGQAVQAYRETWLDRLGRWTVRYQAAILLVLAYLVMRVVVALGSR